MECQGSFPYVWKLPFPESLDSVQRGEQIFRKSGLLQKAEYVLQNSDWRGNAGERRPPAGPFHCCRKKDW